MSLSIEPGEFTVLMGASGSGKNDFTQYHRRIRFSEYRICTN